MSLFKNLRILHDRPLNVFFLRKNTANTLIKNKSLDQLKATLRLKNHHTSLKWQQNYCFDTQLDTYMASRILKPILIRTAMISRRN